MVCVCVSLLQETGEKEANTERIYLEKGKCRLECCVQRWREIFRAEKDGVRLPFDWANLLGPERT